MSAVQIASGARMSISNLAPNGDSTHGTIRVTAKKDASGSVVSGGALQISDSMIKGVVNSENGVAGNGGALQAMNVSVSNRYSKFENNKVTGANSSGYGVNAVPFISRIR